MLETANAVVKGLDEGLQAESSVRNFKVLMDEPTALGGTDKAPNPVELVLTALGGCQVIVAKCFAKAHDFKFEEVYVELEGDFDPDGFMGKNPEVRNGFQEIRSNICFKTEESQEKVDAFVEFIENTCPVGDNLMNGVPVNTQGKIIK